MNQLHILKRVFFCEYETLFYFKKQTEHVSDRILWFFDFSNFVLLQSTVKPRNVSKVFSYQSIMFLYCLFLYKNVNAGGAQPQGQPEKLNAYIWKVLNVMFNSRSFIDVIKWAKVLLASSLRLGVAAVRLKREKI